MRVSFSRHHSTLAQSLVDHLSRVHNLVEVSADELFLTDDSISAIRSADCHLLILTDSFFCFENADDRLPVDFISDIINICLASSKKLIVLNSTLALGPGKRGNVISTKTAWEDDDWSSTALYFQLAHRDVQRGLAEGLEVIEIFVPAIEMENEKSAFQKGILDYLQKREYPSGENAIIPLHELIELLHRSFSSEFEEVMCIAVRKNIKWKEYVENIALEKGMPLPIHETSYVSQQGLTKIFSRLFSSSKISKDRDFLLSQCLLYDLDTQEVET